MVVGFPFRRPQAVVPAPPWWKTAVTFVKSHSCGQSPRKKTLSSCTPPRLLHPLDMMARTPVWRTAWTSVWVIRSGSSMTMLPKPM